MEQVSFRTAEEGLVVGGDLQQPGGQRFHPRDIPSQHRLDAAAAQREHDADRVSQVFGVA